MDETDNEGRHGAGGDTGYVPAGPATCSAEPSDGRVKVDGDERSGPVSTQEDAVPDCPDSLDAWKFDLDVARACAAGEVGGTGRDAEPAPGGQAPARQAPVELRAAQRHRAPLYASPTLRPCRRIEPERTDGMVVGLADLYSALQDDLPLSGGAAMRPTPAGGVHLAEWLRASLPWMEDAIAVLERQLRVALWAGRPWLAWRPLCLVGPPGVGKSHLAREIGRIAGVATAALDLGAMHDAAALVAVGRGWTNTKPCWPAQMMNAHRCANPLLVLDEVEKAGGSRRNGNPLTALLGMLEPSTARTYFDTSLMCEVDLGSVLWICTANDADRLAGPLASRMDVVHVPPPAVEHFDGVLDIMLVGVAVRWGVPPAAMPDVPRRARAVLREAFARRRSLRDLRRNLEDVVAALVSGGRRDVH